MIQNKKNLNSNRNLDSTRKTKFLCILILMILTVGSKKSFAWSDSTATVKDSTTSLIKGGVDLLSNFIWRGVALDPHPCLQPSLAIGNKKIEFGMLGSYSLGGVFNATPVYLKYNIDTKAGIFTPMLFDYYYPFKNIRFDNVDNNGGAHTLEASMTYKTKKIPLRLFFSINVLNDPKNSAYLEGSYIIKIRGQYSIEPFIGASLTDGSNWLGARNAGISNAGITGTRKFTVAKGYTIPLSLSYVVHTQLKYAYLSAKVSFSL